MAPTDTVAIIQARMGSTRLPGKVMKPIAGRPMIHHVVERTRRVDGVDRVVVATSNQAGERPLVEYVEGLDQVELYRGPEDDVLRRYFDAARAFDARAVVRITGDCPLLSPRVSSRVVEAYHRRECDGATNTLERTFPRGLDTAVVSLDALRRTHEEAASPADREHVTRYIWSNPDRFSLINVTDDRDRCHHRWTVDEPADLQLVRWIYDALYSPGEVFEYQRVLQVLDEHPRWMEINAGVDQKRP